MTPFSITSIERGLDGVLVSVARVLDAGHDDGLSPEKAAGRVTQEPGLLGAVIDALTTRARRASDEPSAEAVRLRLQNRLEQWQSRRTVVVGQGKNLVYERVRDPSAQAPLMMSAENARAGTRALQEVPFVVANSMREVQPGINLLVSPRADRLYASEPAGTPEFVLPDDGGEQ